MHEHTTIPFPHQQLLTEDPLTEVVRQGAGSVLDVEMNGDRSMLYGRPSPLPLALRLLLTPSPLENFQAHVLNIHTPRTRG